LLGALAFAVGPTALPLQELKNAVAPAAPEALLLHYMRLTEKVCDNARRRVLEGEQLANEDKIFSIFEPHTELIKRGKQPNPIQYGPNVLVVEDGAGFICHYEVMGNGLL